jgi:hypothetical protein
VAVPSGMCQKMMERDPLPLRRAAGKPSRHRLSQVKHPGLGKQHMTCPDCIRRGVVQPLRAAGTIRSAQASR